jgi:hypothetical protein
VLLMSSSLMAGPRVEDGYDVRWVVPHGKGTKEIKAVLSVEDDALVLRSQSGERLRHLSYDSLNTVAPSTTRHRRWVAGLALGTVVSPLGYGLIFTKSRRHYITFFQDDMTTVVKVSGDDYPRALTQIQSRLPQPLALAMR